MEREAGIVDSEGELSGATHRPPSIGSNSDSSSSSSSDSDGEDSDIPDGSAGNKQGPVDQLRDYRRRDKRLHRQHRGLMQWKVSSSSPRACPISSSAVLLFWPSNAKESKAGKRGGGRVHQKHDARNNVGLTDGPRSRVQQSGSSTSSTALGIRRLASWSIRPSSLGSRPRSRASHAPAKRHAEGKGGYTGAGASAQEQERLCNMMGKMDLSVSEKQTTKQARSVRVMRVQDACRGSYRERRYNKKEVSSIIHRCLPTVLYLPHGSLKTCHLQMPTSC